ncbi:hypothetical protein V6N13_025454 [Hibiscus sabdariffa]|uniref:Uncharacterized protein n=1 Tax=Hibiscus sabdariffa TaxID=183260 RepID=A0ABR2P909_9ROSI
MVKTRFTVEPAGLTGCHLGTSMAILIKEDFIALKIRVDPRRIVRTRTNISMSNTSRDTTILMLFSYSERLLPPLHLSQN